METKKLSFEEWIELAHPWELALQLKIIHIWYNDYQQYLQEPKKKSLKWEDIIEESKSRELFYIDNFSTIHLFKVHSKILGDTCKNLLPTKESCEQELAIIQWIMIAHEANDRWIPDWKLSSQYKWFVRYNYTYNKIDFNYDQVVNSGIVYFKSKELCQQAYEENKEIVNTILGIKL